MATSIKRPTSTPLVSTTPSKKPRKLFSSHPESLIDELKLKIFSHLNAKDLLSGTQVCRSWNQVAQDRSLWKALSLRDFPLADHSSKTTSYLKEYQQHDAVRTNVRKGIFISYTNKENFHNPILSLTRLNEMVYPCDSAGVLQKWDVKNRRIGSASSLNNTTLWQLRGAPEGHLLSVSPDMEIKHHLPIGELQNIKLATYEGNYLYYSAEECKLFYAAPNGVIAVLNLDLENKTMTEIHFLYGHPPLGQTLAHAGEYLITSSCARQGHPSQLNIWKVEDNWKKISPVEAWAPEDSGHSCWLYSTLCAEGLLFSGMADSRIMIWDLKQNRRLDYLVLDDEKNRSLVTALTYADGLLFAGYVDGSIRIWDVKKRVCLWTLHSEIEEKRESPIRQLLYATHGMLCVIRENASQLALFDFTPSHHLVLENIILAFQWMITNPLSCKTTLIGSLSAPKVSANCVLDTLHWLGQSDVNLHRPGLIPFSLHFYQEIVTKFKRMPENTKKQIYDEFQKLLFDRTDETMDGSDAFNDHIELSIDAGEFLKLKMQAIESYIRKSQTEEEEKPKDEET